ncbi:4Fe-4S dicluster domain-containing protein [Lentisphaerota bacterium ZTH]|nr:4Fe-4S dicluster domain-containing protein [Lentisphaerota bacterium]WET07620.1 4Fe-4S dicluster domain-containing protein [Lentisphaerota bacterium ZTH]
MSREKTNYWRIFRIVCAGITFILFILVCFLPPVWSKAVVGQVLPSVLRSTAYFYLAALVSVIIISLITLLIGRVYCSFICPLGTLLDIFTWVFTLGRKKFRRLPSLRSLRYAILVGSVIFALFGVMLPLGLIDPYSFFGRMVATMIQPVYIWADALLYRLSDGSYGMPLPQIAFSHYVFVITLIMLVLLAATAVWRGRIFCNSVCPVGTYLSFLARFSLFKIQLKGPACPGCTKCEAVCKAGCIHLHRQRIDFSRCVMCLNCIESCVISSIKMKVARRYRHSKEISEHFSLHEPAGTGLSDNVSYQKRHPHKREKVHHLSETEHESSMHSHLSNQELLRRRHHRFPEMIDFSRREFLISVGSTGIAAAVAAPLLKLTAAGRSPVMPPGAVDRDRFISRCTSCHLCISHCPSKVIKSAALQYGPAGLMLPYLDYGNRMCEFECNICSNVCPTGALIPLSLKKKQLTRIGLVKYYFDRCIVPRQMTSCGACAEHCPTGALEMKKWRKGLRIPTVHPEYCIGCGACQKICPALPDKAVVVSGLSRHEKAQEHVTIKAEAVSDGFPF